MRRLWLIANALAFFVSCSPGTPMYARTMSETRTDSSQPATVVVELFTSEGCSSCPPADDVLGDLVRRQPFPHVTVIGLGEHVDYWDGLGWRDRFSSPVFTSRQSDYDARTFHTGSIYTPQVVVDGRFQMVGSDRRAIDRAIQDAARSPKAIVTLGRITNSTTTLSMDIAIDVPPEVPHGQVLDVVAGVVERDLSTNVARGENGGRTLKHAAVARRLVTVGTMGASDRAFSKTVSFPVDSTWNGANLQMVAFVQERSTRHILGAASRASR